MTQQEYPGAQEAGRSRRWGQDAFDMMNFAGSVDSSGFLAVMDHLTPLPPDLGQDMFDLMGRPDYVVPGSLGSGGG